MVVSTLSTSVKYTVGNMPVVVGWKVTERPPKVRTASAFTAERPSVVLLSAGKGPWVAGSSVRKPLRLS